VLELVVKAEQAKAPLRLSKLLFDALDRSSPLAVTVMSRCGPGPGAPYVIPMRGNGARRRSPWRLRPQPTRHV
jgi:hypothetical protein